MDQRKIGQFIGQRRKEREMTQKQLADEIGVSDKTVSKWETGNGLPDITMLNALCQALEINVNELLSGEKLPPETYSEKAEENMMNLIKENQSARKTSVVQMGLGIVLLCFSLLMTIIMSAGLEGLTTYLTMFLDLPSLLIVVVPVLALILLSGSRNKAEIVRTMRKQLLPVGCIGTMMGIFFLNYSSHFRGGYDQDVYLISTVVACIPLFYALILYLLAGVAEERLSHRQP